MNEIKQQKETPIKKRELLEQLNEEHGKGNIVQTHEYKNDDTIVGELARWTYSVRGAVRTTKFYKVSSITDKNGFLPSPQYIASWSKGKTWI